MKYQNIKAFKKHLDSASECHLSPIYLLIVPDNYERKKLIDYMCKKLNFADLLSHQIFDANEVNVENIIDSLTSASIFDDPLIVVDNFDCLKKNASELLSGYIEKKRHLILAAKGKVHLSTLIEKIGVVLDLSFEKSFEKEKRFTEEVVEFFAREKKKISLSAVQALVNRVGLDSSLLEQEMKKLLIFAANLEVIDLKEVETISIRSAQVNVWMLAEEVVWRDGFFKGFLKGFEVDDSFFHTLISALRYQLEIGLQIAINNEIPSSISHLPPKVLENRREISRIKGDKFFKAALIYLFEIDLLSKDGITSYNTLLEIFQMRCLLYAKKRYFISSTKPFS